MSRTLLVTGAAGFIGSHTAEALLRRGDRIVGLDNLNDYYDPQRKRANLAELERSPSGTRFRFVEGDIRDRACIDRLFHEEAFDAIVHLAAMAGVRVSIEDPHLYYDTNLTGTLNLLEAARHHRRPHVVFASTSSVYGATETVPFVETMPADRPLAPYPASKRAAELLGHSYAHLHRSTFTALRFFTVYGPRGRPDMMAYRILDNIFFGAPVPLFNGGRMRRDWTFVSDIVAGIVAAADKPLGYEVINLGRGEPFWLSEFVEVVEALAKKKSSLSVEPMNPADVAYTYANIDKAHALLGYAPKVSVREGVASFWEWYQREVLRG